MRKKKGNLTLKQIKELMVIKDKKFDDSELTVTTFITKLLSNERKVNRNPK
jgi:hypothetical protein